MRQRQGGGGVKMTRGGMTFYVYSLGNTPLLIVAPIVDAAPHQLLNVFFPLSVDATFIWSIKRGTNKFW